MNYHTHLQISYFFSRPNEAQVRPQSILIRAIVLRSVTLFIKFYFSYFACPISLANPFPLFALKVSSSLVHYQRYKWKYFTIWTLELNRFGKILGLLLHHPECKKKSNSLRKCPLHPNLEVTYLVLKDTSYCYRRTGFCITAAFR